MLRRLIQRFARELRRLRLASALARSDAALYAHDSRLLAVVKRERVTVPPDCPLPDCSTCPPEPAAPVAPMQRLSLAYTEAWLLEHYPDAWYYELGDGLHVFATGILDLRRRVVSGEMVS